MIILLIIIIIITGILGAYTLNFQKTTLSIGKKLAPDNKMLPNGMQDAITPESQNTSNILLPILLIAIFVVGLFITKWYFSILITAGTFFIVILIFKQFIPKPESKHYLGVIKKSLFKKLEIYKKQKNDTGINAVNFVIEKLNRLK